MILIEIYIQRLLTPRENGYETLNNKKILNVGRLMIFLKLYRQIESSHKVKTLLSFCDLILILMESCSKPRNSVDPLGPNGVSDLKGTVQ